MDLVAGGGPEVVEVALRYSGRRWVTDVVVPAAARKTGERALDLMRAVGRPMLWRW